ELDGEDVFLLHRCCERQTVLTNASYRTVVPVLDIVAVHEVEPFAVGNILPQGMRHALAHFIPAHVRDFQALPGFLQVGAEKADTPGNQADTIDAAVLFTEIHHGLHADADTSSGMAGGEKAKMTASLTWLSAPMARPATALALMSSASRSLQSRSLMKATPLFWPRPAKLKPWTLNTDSTESFSSSRKYCYSFMMDSMVRSWVAPTGAFTMENRTPWSSSGRNEPGTRMNSRIMATTRMPKMAMKRPLRCSMPRTLLW